MGDLDLGLHLVRTQALRAGEPLSAVTERRLAANRPDDHGFCPPPTTGYATVVTRRRSPPFQEWFVAGGHRDEVDAVGLEGADRPPPAPGALERLCRGRRARDRAEQPDVTHLADPRRRRSKHALARRRVPCVPSAPSWRPRSEGAGRPDAPAAWPAARPRACTSATRPDRRAGHRRGRSADEACVPLVRARTLMTDVEASRRLAETVHDGRVKSPWSAGRARSASARARLRDAGWRS